MRTVVRQGLVAPAIVAAITLVAWPVAGPEWALATLAAGAASIIAWHLYNAQRVLDWASGALDGRVPESRREWGDVFSAIYRRTRLRDAQQRDLQHILMRFRQAAEAIPDGIVVLDRNQRIEWANPHAVAQLGLDLEQDVGQPIVNLVRQPEFLRYLDTGDYGESTMVPSSRAPGHTLALQLVPFAVDKKLLMSRDVTAMELPDTLAFRLHAWRQTGVLEMYSAAEGFGPSSWLAIHSGMGNWPEHLDPVLGEVPFEEAREALRQRREQIAAMVETMPTHDAYLRSVRK